MSEKEIKVEDSHNQKTTEVNEEIESAQEKSNPDETAQDTEENIAQEEKSSVDIEETVKSSKDEISDRVKMIQEDAAQIFSRYNATLDEFNKSSSMLAEEESSVINGTIKETLEYFDKINIEQNSDILTTLKEIKIDNQEELLRVKEPTKGKFKGIIFSLIAALLTTIAIFAYGAKMIGVELKSVVNRENLDAISAKYSTLISENLPQWGGYVGAILSSMIAGFIVYKIVILMKKINNKKYIESKEKESIEYKLRVQSKIESLNEVIEHIDRANSVTQKYDVILKEQNGKLNRIIYIEEPESINNLHTKSKVEVDKTKLLLDEIVNLMKTEISIDDKLNLDSVHRLKSANVLINEVIKGLY